MSKDGVEGGLIKRLQGYACSLPRERESREPWLSIFGIATGKGRGWGGRLPVQTEEHVWTALEKRYPNGK